MTIRTNSKTIPWRRLRIEALSASGASCAATGANMAGTQERPARLLIEARSLRCGVLALPIKRFARPPDPPMFFARHLPAISRRCASSASSAWFLARRLLVLALAVAVDHVSAPSHHHLHEGAGGQFEVGTVHACLDGGETHADGDEHSPGSRAAMAIRVDPSRVGQLPAADLVVAAAAVSVAFRLFAALADPPPAEWRPDRSQPDFRSHPSLPPACLTEATPDPFHASQVLPPCQRCLPQ